MQIATILMGHSMAISRWPLPLPLALALLVAPVSATRAQEIDSAGLAVTGKPRCQPSDGTYDPGGTFSWVPTCAGNWFVSPNSPLPTMAVVGVSSSRRTRPFVPDMSVIGSTQALVQAIARKEEGAETAFFVNMDVAHGGGHVGQRDQKVGIADFVRLHPNRDGSKPGDAWAFNPDIQVAANSGNMLAINTEADFNNFNDCGDRGCFMVMLWHNYLSGYPITADTYISGDSPTHKGFGKVLGEELESLAGDAFTKDTTTITVDGRLVRVLKVTSPRRVLLSENVGSKPRVAYAWNSHLVHSGIMIANDNAVADHDFVSSSSGYYAFYLNGHHNVLLAAAGDAAPYVVVARPGQAVCFNGVDGCLLNTDVSRIRYQAHGNPVFEAAATEVPNASYIVLSNGAAARIGVAGPSETAPLVLAGKQGAPVVVESPLKLPSYKIDMLPTCRTEALGEAVFVVDTKALLPPTWHGEVKGGGNLRVRSAATCNGEFWQYD